MKKILFAIFCFVQIQANAQDAAKAANAFLNLLDAPQKAKATYVLDDPERVNWHFIPRDRNGLPLKSMTQVQRDGALALLKVSLSEKGYGKAKSIMANEDVLRQVEGRPVGDTHRDPLNYYFTIFGTPSKDKPWGWKFEGHHLAINFTFNEMKMVSSTPNFWGANPGTVLDGPEKGRQLLKMETALGFELVNSLTDDQKKIGIIADTAPAEIITGNNRTADALKPVGLPYSGMNPSQQKLLGQLLDLYVQNYELGFSAKFMEKITKAGINNLSFAWAGSLKPGVPNYYRIQGPTLLIEYDNTQNNANHVHTVVRDLTNDFGDDILREHYQKEHH
jgi:hypothetical protein